MTFKPIDTVTGGAGGATSLHGEQRFFVVYVVVGGVADFCLADVVLVPDRKKQVWRHVKFTAVVMLRKQVPLPINIGFITTDKHHVSGDVLGLELPLINLDEGPVIHVPVTAYLDFGTMENKSRNTRGSGREILGDMTVKFIGRYNQVLRRLDEVC